jgi:hypothetical protein
MASEKTAKNVVLSCVEAINREDYKLARQYASDDFSVARVLGSRHGADSYLSDIQRMRLKYDLKKVFADDRDACLFCDMTISGTTIFGSAWHRVESEKIRSLTVVFDPRPLLEDKPTRQ